jgi:hypothetical protein
VTCDRLYTYCQADFVHLQMMKTFAKHFDVWSLIVIVITFVLFGIALFTKGLTHDILLEIGVLLVSVKLIVMAYRNAVASSTIQKKPDAIYITLKCNEPESPGD